MNESLKELAVRYFEGPIAPEEECELFGFLAASPENAALMRELGIQKWHQMQVVYVACFQVRQLFLHTLQIAGKSVDIQHHAKHILAAVPCRLLFSLPVQLLF